MTIRFEPIEAPKPCTPRTQPANGAEEPVSTSPSPETTSPSNAQSATPEPAPDEPPKKKRNYGGRCLKGNEHLTLAKQKPWKKLKLSRSTWFRRRKDGTL